MTENLAGESHQTGESKPPNLIYVQGSLDFCTNVSRKEILQGAQEVNFYDLMCSWTTTTVFSVGRVSRIKSLPTLLLTKLFQACPAPSNPLD